MLQIRKSWIGLTIPWICKSELESTALKQNSYYYLIGSDIVKFQLSFSMIMTHCLCNVNLVSQKHVLHRSSTWDCVYYTTLVTVCRVLSIRCWNYFTILVYSISYLNNFFGSKQFIRCICWCIYIPCRTPMTHTMTIDFTKILST